MLYFKITDCVSNDTLIEHYVLRSSWCFEQLSRLVYLRRFGGDCYSYGLLASGQIDLVVEGSLHYYDIMALIPVVEGAGGVITDWQGNMLEEGWDGLVVAAATPELHQAALHLLNSH